MPLLLVALLANAQTPPNLCPSRCVGPNLFVYDAVPYCDDSYSGCAVHCEIAEIHRRDRSCRRDP